MKKLIFFIVLVIAFTGCSNTPNDFAGFKDEGSEAFTKGDYASAVTSFQNALRFKQSDKETLMLLGQSFLKVGKPDSALFYYRRADLLNPKDPEINRTIYDIAIQLGEYQYALNALYAIISTGVPEDNFLEQIAELNLRLGFAEAAYSYYNKLIVKSPDNPNYYLILSNLASHIPDSVHAAVEIIDRAIDKFGPREELLVNKAIYLAGMKRYTEAENIFREQIKLSENPNPIKLNLANVLTGQDDRPKKLEGLNLYKEIRDEGADLIPIIDSIINVLEQELK